MEIMNLLSEIKEAFNGRFLYDLMSIAKSPLNTISTMDDTLLLSYVICIVALLILLTLMFRIAVRFLPIYPMTAWGFRAKLLYADDSGQKKIFLNKNYKLSANPDFVYRLRNSKTAYIEFKSRTYVMDSDIAQLEIGIIALRDTYNVTRGAIALSNGKLHWIDSAKKSSRSLYKKNKSLIEQAKRIKQGQWVPPVRKSNCNKCPMKQKCWG